MTDRVWKVVLHNDEGFSGERVVEIIKKHLSYSEQQCRYIMLEAHKHGKATVVSAIRQIAEHYEGCLSEEGLTITLEQ